MLGRDWIDRSRIQGSPPSLVRGIAPTLRVASMGQQLSVLRGLPKAETLISRIRRGNYDAEAELTAIYLLASGQSGVVIDLQPAVSVRGRSRRPDFRARRRGTRWTYVEVTQPNTSDLQKRVQQVLNRLTALVSTVKKPFALEVLLRRGPSAREVENLTQVIPAFCARDGVHSEDLPNELGKLFLNHDPPGRPSLRQHAGEEERPRLGAARAVFGPDEPLRHIMVRIAFADERAERFLRREAGQLPKDGPGLIMVQMSGAPGGFRSWEPLLGRRFSPSQHTRVSAICLWESGLEPTPSGEAWIPRTKLILNRYARYGLPSWVAASLARWEGSSGVGVL